MAGVEWWRRDLPATRVPTRQRARPARRARAPPRRHPARVAWPPRIRALRSQRSIVRTLEMPEPPPSCFGFEAPGAHCEPFPSPRETALIRVPETRRVQLILAVGCT